LFEAATAGVVDHFAKLKRPEWEAVMNADKAVFSKVESMIGEIRHKVSSNAGHLFEASFRESFMKES
jgi:hypothetical protein